MLRILPLARLVTMLATLAILALLAFPVVAKQIEHPDGFDDNFEGAGSGSISTNRTQYTVGDDFQYCYQVPGPGVFVRISRSLPNGSSAVVLEGIDDGAGDCAWGKVQAPLGRRTLRIDVYSGDGSKLISTNQTTYEVVAGR